MFDYAPLGDPDRDERPAHVCGIARDCTPDCFTADERAADPTIQATYNRLGFLPPVNGLGEWMDSSDFNERF